MASSPPAAATAPDAAMDDGDECPVCLEPLSSASPVALPCRHAICRACVTELWEVQQCTLATWKDGHLTCPLCRANHLVGAQGLDTFLAAVAAGPATAAAPSPPPPCTSSSYRECEGTGGTTSRSARPSRHSTKWSGFSPGWRSRHETHHCGKTLFFGTRPQIQIQIESLHTRLDETDEMTSAGGIPAGPFLGARTTRAPRDAGGPPFVLSARAEPRIKGGELQ